jgi:hypothetical protein
MLMSLYPLPELMKCFAETRVEVRYVDWMADGDVWSAAWYLHKPGRDHDGK